MKNTILSLLGAISLLISTQTFSQTTVVSTDGYSVTISVQPKAIVPTSSSCTNGYNYNVRMDYNITFSGNNIPSSLYTLQGTLGCGTNSHFFNLPNNGGAGSVTSGSNVWRSITDCNAATVSTLSCNIINIQIQGPGISSRTVTFVVSNTPLPVTLVDFSAAAANKKVKLTWSTSTEINNDFFTVERSENGSSWTAINTINGAGNSSQLINYQSYDANPVSGTAYYRIKQTDIDGKFTYSETRTVKYTGTATISVFPIPNAGNTVNFTNMSDTKNMVMTVINASGVTIHRANLSATAAQLPNLTAGLYIIRLTNKISGDVTNLRYIKS